MAKKTVKKPVKKPVTKIPDEEKAVKVKKVFEPKPVKETVKYSPRIEIDASKLKILTVNGGEEGDEMLLICKGEENVHLNKWIIIGGNITHARCVFEKEWELVSICRI